VWLFFRDIIKAEKIVYRLLGPIIEERRKAMKENPESFEKPVCSKKGLTYTRLI
jgi:hypothetical protein